MSNNFSRMLIDDSGNVFVDASDHSEFFSHLECERLNVKLIGMPSTMMSGDYVRLIGIPPMRDSNYPLPPVFVTMKGELYFTSRQYPEGIYLSTNLPPIKQVFNPAGTSTAVLDVENRLTFLDIGKMISEHPNEYSDHPTRMSIENVKTVINTLGLIILTHDDQLISYNRTGSIYGATPITGCSEPIHDIFDTGIMITRSGSIYVIDWGGDRLEVRLIYRIDYPLDSFIKDDYIYYTLSNGIVRIVRSKGEEIINVKFNPIRFIRLLGSCYIEDDQGNLHRTRNLARLNLPFRLINHNQLDRYQRTKNSRTIITG